ncbi:hypothetical protein QBC44DRAFT_37408 [Cladorrhinum sp. PSN332]|nr:hypothetical protein QBC44DRAFT_37408 [Cladorrhinum sp. PSN332]
MVPAPIPVSSIPVFTLPASISTPGTPTPTTTADQYQGQSLFSSSSPIGSNNNKNSNGDPDDNGDKPPFTDPRALLLYLYADLARLKEIAAEDVVLHPADRAITGSGPLVGVEACQQHEELFAGGGRVKMRVDNVMVNERFGCVFGVLEVGNEEKDKVEARFCGVWRFEWFERFDGGGGGGSKREVKAVEHWENLDGEGEVRRVMGALRG